MVRPDVDARVRERRHMRFDRLFYAGIIVGLVVAGAVGALVWKATAQ